MIKTGVSHIDRKEISGDRFSFEIDRARRGTLRVEAVVAWSEIDNSCSTPHLFDARVFDGIRELSVDEFDGDDALWAAIVSEATRLARVKKLEAAQDLHSLWRALFSSYPVQLPRRWPREWASQFKRVEAMHDRRGVRWSLEKKRVPLGVPYIAPPDCGLWHLHNPEDLRRPTYCFAVDVEKRVALEATGLLLGPALLVCEGDQCEHMAVATCNADTLCAYDNFEMWPAYRVRKGIFARVYTEGGWQDEAIVTRATSFDGPVPAVDATSVSRAVGVDLRNLRCRDASEVSLDWFEVAGNVDIGFVMSFLMDGTLCSDSRRAMEKAVKLTWNVDDGDPYAFLLAALADLDLEPGATDSRGF